MRAAVASLSTPAGRESLVRLPGTRDPGPETRGSLSERDLARLWERQTFPKGALATRGGEALRVIYRGRPGAGPGPDFRDAIIAAPWGLLAGDVELHVRASDFRLHGHHLDPAYDGLALHLVFWDDRGEDTPLAGGGRAPVVALGAWVEGRAEIRSWLRRRGSWSEPCRSAVARMGAEAVAATLDRLGDMRFRQKAAAFRRRLASESGDEVVWQGLLEALGYGGEREPWRELARQLPWVAVARSLEPLGARRRPETARRLLMAAAEEAGLSLRSAARPGNEPGRRLEGAARLAPRFAEKGPARSLEAVLPAGLPGLLAALAVEGTPSALIGRGRALEIIANAVLPYLAAAGQERTAESLYRELPAAARYGAVRHLHEATAGAVLANARRQQGMLYLLRQYCTQGGCGRCPLS